MAITVVDDFESYSTGDLHGGNGGQNWSAAWSGDTLFDVATAGSPNAGTKHISIVPTADAYVDISRTFTAASAGTIFISVKVNRTGGAAGKSLRLDLKIKSGSTLIGRIICRISDAANIIELLDNASFQTLTSSFTNNTYFRVGIEWDDVAQNNKYRANINNGAFSSWYSSVSGASFTTIDTLEISASNQDAGATGTCYFDTVAFQYEYPITSTQTPGVQTLTSSLPSPTIPANIAPAVQTLSFSQPAITVKDVIVWANASKSSASWSNQDKSQL